MRAVQVPIGLYLRNALNKGANELITNCKQLKLPAADGKNYSTDVADTEQHTQGKMVR